MTLASPSFSHMSFDLDNKTFTAACNSANGEVGSDTLFFYKQVGDIIQAEYRGGEIVQGNLLGRVTGNKTFEFNYQHISADLSLKAGHCKSTVSFQQNGAIILSENWQWFSGDKSKGTSQLVESNTYATV